MIVERLKQEGLSDAYNEQAHGELVILSIHTDSDEQRNRVIGILEDAGVYNFKQSEERAA
jgi:hypothetical protein